MSIFGIESDFSNRIDTTLQYVVPVGLSAFSGYVSPNNSIILQWHTTSESTNYGFEVQRCPEDQTLFETIGFVKGFGTTMNPKSYRFEDNKVIEGTYQYRLKQINYDGASTFSDIIQITLTVPRAPYLYQNYPNPFNNSTEIAYDLPLSGHVALIIYDETGRQVCRLVDQFQNKGKHKVKWGARDMLGRGVGSGVYYCGIKTISSAIFRRLVYIR
jgi:hypothetical protein